MALEQLANNASSTLDGAINDSTTSVVVASAATFPSTANFRILIDSEYMLVTAIAGTTFTVSRGQEGSAAAAHSNGATVTHVLTKEGLIAFRGDAILTGTTAARPAAATNGRIYLPNDGLVAYRDTGSAWNAFGPIWPLTPPDDGSLTWYNQGSATTTTANGFTFLSSPTNGGSHNFRIRGKALAVSSNYTLTFGFGCLQAPGSSGWCGVMLRDSSGGALQSFGVGADGGTFMELWNSVSSFSSTLWSQNSLAITGGPIMWVRFQDDGTNRLTYISRDRFNWRLIDSRTRTNFFTPNSFGFWVNPFGATIGLSMFHLVEE